MFCSSLQSVNQIESDWNMGPGHQTANALEDIVRPGDVVLTVDAQSYLPIEYYLEQSPNGASVSAVLYDWYQPNWSPFIGTSLITPGRVVSPDVVAKVGWLGAMPGLSPNGTIWLVSIADGGATEIDFDALHSGSLAAGSGDTFYVNPAEGSWGQIRPLVLPSA
jgi:hypothetical protein